MKKGPYIKWIKCECGTTTPLRKGDKEQCHCITEDGRCKGKTVRALSGCGCVGEHTERCRTYCGPD